jgi:hypothetical protein
MRLSFALSLACLFSVGCIADLREHEVFEKTVPLAAAGTFHLENTNGTLKVGTWDRPEVKIHATKNAVRPSEIEIRVVASPQDVEVRTVLPHTIHLSFERAPSVNYEVQVPASAGIDLETVNGKVEVTDPGGRLKLSSVNGTINVRGARGEVRTSTTNGTVKIACAQVNPEGIYELSTINGKVELDIPGNTRGHFEGSTVNGWIETDFPLEITRKLLSHRLSGQLGEGGATFRLSAVNGLLAIRKTLN